MNQVFEVFRAGHSALITGAALGIGRAAAIACAKRGMKVVMVDVDGEALENAANIVCAEAVNPSDVQAVRGDIAGPGAWAEIRSQTERDFGIPHFLMNNAVTRAEAGFWSDLEDWRRAADINLWAVAEAVQRFVPDMVARGERAAVVNVGSKQGITNPPGKPCYNMLKAALKSYTEGLEHELRQAPGRPVTTHLLIPGWTTTGHAQHKDGAWLPEQVVDRMIEGVLADDFYILCPDNEVTAEMDRKRILWGAGDITENRPPLSRWQGDFGAAFDAFEP